MFAEGLNSELRGTAAAKIVRGVEKVSYRIFVGLDSSLLGKLNRLWPVLAATGKRTMSRSASGQPLRPLPAAFPSGTSDNTVI